MSPHWVLNTFGFAKGGLRRRPRLLSSQGRGIMKKIIALVILAVVAAGFFSLTVPRHVLNTLGFAMADCTDGAGC
jgi:hypothetical protein